jgi:hypothetical protein
MTRRHLITRQRRNLRRRRPPPLIRWEHVLGFASAIALAVVLVARAGVG